MLAKIVFLIVSLAAIACSVLAIRQSRLQTASEIVQAQVRINAMDERLAALRIGVAEQVAPERVRELAAGIADLVPLAQAAGDVAREQERAKALELERLRKEAEAARAAPQADPGSLHNPDGTPRSKPKPTPNRTRTPANRSNGGAA